MATGQELDIVRDASADQMATTIFGNDVQIIDARYDGQRSSSGIYSNGDSISPDATPSDSGVILSTGRVQDFTRGGGDPNRATDTTADTSGDDNDPDFNALTGTNTFDAAFLEVDCIPTTDALSIRFIFASEEYPEFAGSTFNDAVGIWINGTLVTSPVFGVSNVNSVNQSSNETLYNDNTCDAFNTEMDGFTVTLTVLIPVVNGAENTIKIGIADAGDSAHDSAILIAANSVQGSFLANDDSLTVKEQQTGILDVVQNDGTGTGIMIEAGNFGHHRRLVVSPQHRVLLTHWMAELMFGEDEVLIAARDLTNGVSVRPLHGGRAEYFHILFDAHQIVWSEGLLTESFLPGPQVMNTFEDAVRHEVLSLFPEIDPVTHQGYGLSARPGLCAHEARAKLG